MSVAGPAPRTRQSYLDQDGTLIVLRPAPALPPGPPGAAAVAPSTPAPASMPPELLLMVADDGRVTAFNGHVDLGTGIRTALAQIVAEELDVSVGDVHLVLGDTDTAPNQGPTIASETIQIAAVPLRQAAAQARHFLLALAAKVLGRDAADLRIAAGSVATAAGEPSIAIGALLAGRRERLMLRADMPLKAVADYRVVGQAVQRVDIPAKATGQWTYVHDVRLPGMLHGRVVRPPYAGLDSGDFVGTSLLAVDESSIGHLPGVVATVVVGDFIGVVGQREEQAGAAAAALRVRWKPVPAMPNLQDLQAALLAQPSQPRTLRDTGNVDARLGAAATRMPRTYVWPYQLHGSMGPSCAVADYRDDALTVWSGTQNPHSLRNDLALLMKMPADRIQVVRLEAAGCYGRNGADDVTADAALLSRAVGRPVRVQLTREQEHLWDPKGAAQVMQVDGGLMADGSVAAYDFSTRYPSNAAPTLALLLTGAIAPVAAVSDMGDRTAIPPYRYDALRVVVHDMAPLVRAAWLRGVSAMPNSFAHESYVDELAAAAGVDPIAFRLRHLDDARAIALIHSVAERAGWEARTAARCAPVRPGVVRGQGFAYARYIHGKFPGTAAAWSAWVAEVEVELATGRLTVTRVVVGQDTGLVINPAGVQHQIHGNVIQSVSRAVKEQVQFDDHAVASREWGTYPILTFPEVPVIQVVMVPRPDDPPLGAGESASVPSAAAIANAIFDATGVRMREPPFTPERVRAALGQRGRLPPAAGAPDAPPDRRTSRWRWLLPFLGGALGMAAALVPLRSAIAPMAASATQLYSAQTLERGRQLAALGNCADCHTAAGGAPYAGGRRIATPYGEVMATNITPDAETGIGAWSYPAFARAMREGVHRDGHRLYPVFPYTAFARMTEADLQALYGFFMAQTPVRAQLAATRLDFPFNLRPLLAFWNGLFLRPDAYGADPARSELWNRGAYLVEGPGHCSACHSPRNMLGAQLHGDQHLGGALTGGWEAPALNALSPAPVPWTEGELFTYLRTGNSHLHGAALGPMRAVVHNLAQLQESDVRAMAHYLGSLQPPPLTVQQQEDRVLAAQTRARLYNDIAFEDGAQIYAGACAVCHDAGPGALLAVRSSLALNSSVHSSRPDNVLRAILDGVNPQAVDDPTAMPSFRNALDDRQVAQVLAYMRARFAGDKPPWEGLRAAAATSRAAPEVESHADGRFWHAPSP